MSDSPMYGLFITLFIIVIGVLSFHLGKQKTTTPKMTALMGVMLAVIPPLGIIYVVVLYFRKNIIKDS